MLLLFITHAALIKHRVCYNHDNVIDEYAHCNPSRFYYAAQHVLLLLVIMQPSVTEPSRDPRWMTRALTCFKRHGTFVQWDFKIWRRKLDIFFVIMHCSKLRASKLHQIISIAFLISDLKTSAIQFCYFKFD